MHINPKLVLKQIRCLSLLLVTCVVSTGWLSGQTPPHRHDPGNALLHGKMRPGGPSAQHIPKVLNRAREAHLPANVTSQAVPTPCPPDAQAMGAACGYVNVPFDRTQPQKAILPIYFELFTHTDPGPAVSAILVNFGGPGPSTTAQRGVAFWVFGQNLDKHDLLLIDDRGRGLSGALDCEKLQHGTAPWDEAVADCAAQVGANANRYGTGDVAEDTEAVRAALGYDKVDYYGGSYGGADVTAYATRFGKHLRSLVLDAPVGTPALDTFALDAARAHRTANPITRSQRRYCKALSGPLSADR